MILGDALEGEAAELGIVLAGVARAAVTHGNPIKGPAVILSGGETTVTVRGSYDSAAQTYTLHASQQTAPTPGQPEKRPLPIPLGVGLVGPDGDEQ